MTDETAGLRLPASVKVGYRRYGVVEFDPHQASNQSAVGETDPVAGLIRVRVANTPQDEQADTLIHEILHCLVKDSGLGLDGEEEERVVGHLSPRLTAFMADNKYVVRSILDAL